MEDHVIEYLNGTIEWYEGEIDANEEDLKQEENPYIVQSLRQEIEFYHQMINFNNALLDEIEKEGDAPLLQLLADGDKHP